MPDQEIDEETLRKLEEQLRKAPPIAGFVASAKTREEQRKKFEEEQAERERKRQQQAMNPGQLRSFTPSDMFLKALAQVYDLPPEPKSFPQGIVPILMASTVVNFDAQQKVLVGRFSGARELPPIQIAKNGVIAQGGNLQSQPELAIQLAMLALSNPDMQRDGVEIVGVTEEDKMMLLAAADTLGLKVLNRDQITVDQNQNARMAACKQAIQNLQEWSVPGNAAAPAPTPGNQPGQDDGSQPQPVVSPQPSGNNGPSNAAAAAAAAAAIPAVADAVKRAVSTPADNNSGNTGPGNQGTGKQPASAANTPEESKPEYSDLTADQKKFLRELFRDERPGQNFTDEEVDARLTEKWKNLSKDEQLSELLRAGMHQLQKDQAKAASPAAEAEDLLPPEKPEIPPAPAPKPLGERKFAELLPAERHALRDHAKASGKPYDSAQKSWDRLGPANREKRLTEAIRQATKKDKAVPGRLEAQRKKELRDMSRAHDAAVEKLEQDHKAALELFKAAVIAADPSAPRDAPALRPVESRKFKELLPAEQELLRAYARSKKEDEKKAGAKWNRLNEDARKKLFDEAGAAKKTLGFDAVQQQKTAVQALADAAARAKAKAAADIPPPLPVRTWDQLDDDERDILREDIGRSFKRNDGAPLNEDNFSNIWNDSSRQRGGAWQAATIERARKQGEKFKAMTTPPPSADDRVLQEQQVAAVTPPPSAADRIQQEHEAGAPPAVAPAPQPAAQNAAPEVVTPVAATGPIANIPAAPSKPLLQRAKEWFMNNVWAPFVSHFKSAQAPAPLQRIEPVFDLPLNEPEAAGETPAAPGVDVAAKKEFKDLFTQEKRLLLVDKLKRGDGSTSGELEAEWNTKDEAGRAAQFNQAFENQPQLRDSVIAGQEAESKPPSAPAVKLDMPEPVASAAVVVAETTTPAASLKDIGERQWSELLDSEKEAIKASDPDSKDHEAGWNGWDTEMRNTAFAIGIDGNPDLAARIEEARKAENARLAAANPAATTPPDANADRVEQAKITPPLAAADRVEQNDSASQPVVAPDEVDEIPQGNPDFDKALDAKGITVAALLAMPPEQRKDVLAAIKTELEQARTQPPAVLEEPSAKTALPAPGLTAAAFKISADTIRDLPPSEDAKRVVSRSNLPTRIDREKFLEAYRQIRAEVVKATPGSRVTQAFLGNAARKNHTEELLGHKGLTSPEAHVILDALRAEGLTTGKKDTHRNPSYAASDWQARLESHYEPPAGPEPT